MIVIKFRHVTTTSAFGKLLDPRGQPGGPRGNEVDFALVSVLPSQLRVERVELMQNKLFLVGKTGKMKDKENFGPDSLAKLPLIYREQGSATRQAMERYIRSHGITLQRSMELMSNEAVEQAVIAGLGYSIMPLIGLKNELLNKELEILPLEGLPITTHWNLIWLKGKSQRPIAAAYLEYLNAHKEEVIKENFGWYEQY